ncbi:hypothetical protein D869_gp307 [Caulobacter phage CcrRogue]|uniref:Uncharacterized protein n=1 Tax=Caulobacter phage CcrRogue TaxID=2927986 RepID=K4K318_9CAUD|nr:hypothetical protein D869_gp307 [Caulobacter phage CcrRogue]AFU86607.1 hypothetical protein CcrRogue_gp125 [Caulobacter phage CcrRogue]
MRLDDLGDASLRRAVTATQLSSSPGQGGRWLSAGSQNRARARATIRSMSFAAAGAANGVGPLVPVTPRAMSWPAFASWTGASSKPSPAQRQSCSRVRLPSSRTGSRTWSDREAVLRLIDGDARGGCGRGQAPPAPGR